MNKLLENKNIIAVFAFAMVVVICLTLFVFKLGVADNGVQTFELNEIGLKDAQAAVGSGYYSDTYIVEDTKISFKTSSLFYEIFKRHI